MKPLITASLLLATCLALGCEPPGLVQVDKVRQLTMQKDREFSRMAYFDAALRVLSRHGYVFETSDRPAVINTTWKGELLTVAGEKKTAFISFKLQFTTSNQGSRMQSLVNDCSVTKQDCMGVPSVDAVPCPAGTADKIDPWEPETAAAIEAYLTNLNKEIDAEVPIIYQEMRRSPDGGSERRLPAEGYETAPNPAKEPPAPALVVLPTRVGTGPVPQAGSKVRLHVVTTHEGRKLDDSIIEYKLGDPQPPCMADGLSGMHIGGAAKIICPKAAGTDDLIFEVELMEQL